MLVSGRLSPESLVSPHNMSYKDPSVPGSAAGRDNEVKSTLRLQGLRWISWKGRSLVSQMCSRKTLAHPSA